MHKQVAEKQKSVSDLAGLPCAVELLKSSDERKAFPLPLQQGLSQDALGLTLSTKTFNQKCNILK